MPHILIIEDDEQVRLMLRMTFESKGYEVDTAPNGKEGIKRYREKQADVVITDLIMPEKEGLETILELRNEFQNAKIIAISGGGKLSPDGYLKVAADFGAEFTFPKPVPTEQLVDAVESLVGKSESCG